MNRSGAVPERLQNGSSAALVQDAGGFGVVQDAGGFHVRALAPATLLGCCALVSCLHGDAEPIVGLPEAASGMTPESGAEADANAGGASCVAGAPLALHYDNQQVAANANGIDFLFKVTNATGAAVPLTSLGIRYYFTNEIAPKWDTVVYYADTCCGQSRSGFTADVNVAVVAMSPTRTADHYLETTFSAAAGDLLDGDSVQVEVGFHAPGSAQNLDQANDYSFLPTETGTQAEWDSCPSQCDRFRSCVMTVYDSGVLVWGVPPT